MFACMLEEISCTESIFMIHYILLAVCHAELNAILNKISADVKDCTIYVAMFPCNECAKVIIQSGIREVVYASDKHAHKPPYQASRRLFNMAGVKLTSVSCFCSLLFVFDVTCRNSFSVFSAIGFRYPAAAAELVFGECPRHYGFREIIVSDAEA
jgi:deoxycytidylate deaminase